MVKQVEDRRSAVSKQACQTLAALSRLYGLRFQDLLLYYVPVLLRIVPITVQVRRRPGARAGVLWHAGAKGGAYAGGSVGWCFWELLPCLTGRDWKLSACTHNRTCSFAR